MWRRKKSGLHYCVPHVYVYYLFLDIEYLPRVKMKFSNQISRIGLRENKNYDNLS